jgi:hypothetical protein
VATEPTVDPVRHVNLDLAVVISYSVEPRRDDHVPPPAWYRDARRHLRWAPARLPTRGGFENLAGDCVDALRQSDNC